MYHGFRPNRSESVKRVIFGSLWSPFEVRNNWLELKTKSKYEFKIVKNGKPSEIFKLIVKKWKKQKKGMVFWWTYKFQSFLIWHLNDSLSSPFFHFPPVSGGFKTTKSNNTLLIRPNLSFHKNFFFNWT